MKLSGPDGVTAVNEHVLKIKSIKYFSPERNIEDANSLVPKIGDILEKYVASLAPWRREGMSLQHASDALWDLARVAALKGDRSNHWDSIWDHVWKEASYSARDNYGWYGGGYQSGESARDAARDAAKYAARYVAFESVADIMKNPNPFAFIIDLYSMGLKPTYFRKVGEEERFVVDVPVKIGDRSLLGCLVQGDSSILFTHDWSDYCSSLKPLKGDLPSRTLV